MKRTDAKTLTIVELLQANRDTLGKIKRGDTSLCLNPIKNGEKEKGVELNVKDQAVLLIWQIVEGSADNLKDGVKILRDAKQTFIETHLEDD